MQKLDLKRDTSQLSLATRGFRFEYTIPIIFFEANLILTTKQTNKQQYIVSLLCYDLEILLYYAFAEIYKKSGLIVRTLYTSRIVSRNSFSYTTVQLVVVVRFSLFLFRAIFCLGPFFLSLVFTTKPGRKEK